jgi:WD40 repeat protein
MADALHLVGGARSLSVFDNDIGSGTVSPLIVTGGKSGGVALHDLRFISTGKSKHHKTTAGGSSSGMIWHIPKAHLGKFSYCCHSSVLKLAFCLTACLPSAGSVTSLSTIPNTTLFLTGSKDGDVKLWDANNSQLVFHWQKLHERHTFFQPTSRGFGGVVRVCKFE